MDAKLSGAECRSRRLTEKEVLDRIASNGGPQGLGFKGCDLSGTDLSWRTARRHTCTDTTGQPAWYSSATHGINLKGAVLHGTILSEAKLVQADLEGATLNGAILASADCHDSRFADSFMLQIEATKADFSYCDMRGCYLIEANLHRANLSNTLLQGANLAGADLSRATLCYARLTEADLTGARLQDANLFGVWLNNTLLTRQQIGDHIIQERDSYIHPEPLHKDQTSHYRTLLGRHAQASSVYCALKNNFQSIGNYSDASWAYIKERKSRRRTHWPPRGVRESYPNEFASLPATGMKSKFHRLRFYLGHLLAGTLDCIFELTSAYGERPLLAFWWALACVLVFAAVFRWIGGIGGTDTWLDYLNYSLGAFVTVSFSGQEAQSPLAKALTSIEASLGICLLALLMFALGNRINRS